MKCGICSRVIESAHYTVQLYNGSQMFTLNAHSRCLEDRIDNPGAVRRFRTSIFDAGWIQAELPT
jgi:hypothetical protein